jgi:SSS family solute:Na+ symporter/sodium/pantothenate symporter
MAETTIAWLFFGAYLLLVGAAAVWGIRKVTGFASFSVGSRQVNPVFVGLSLAANLTSAATFVINPGLMYDAGVSGFIAFGIATPLGIVIGLTVLSKAFRQVGDEFTVLTVPQWIGDRFGDKRLTIFYAVASLLQITFLVLITVGLTRVLASVLQIPMLAAMAITLLFPLAYIMYGGASAHTLTNTAQALIMIVVAGILIGSGLQYFSGGLGGFLDQLRAVDPLLAQATNPESYLFRDWFEVAFCNFVIGLAIITQPHIISKALYLKSERDVNAYLVTGFIVMTLFFCVLAVGLFAHLALPGAGLAPDTVVPTYIVEVFGPVTRSIVMVGLIAAGFSTMEGLLVALSTIFSNDLYRHFAQWQGRLTTGEIEQRGIRYSKWFLVGLAPVVALISYGQIVSPTFSVAILGQNGVYALFSATFAPILFGIFSEKMPRGGVLAAGVTALVVHFGMYYGEISMYANNPAVPATCAIIASTAVAGAFLVLAPEGARTKQTEAASSEAEAPAGERISN